jgi:S-adenosylmethionine hydrolase
VALDLPAVSAGEGVLAGRARYIDGFGNVLTGITRAQLISVFGDRDPAQIVASVGGADIGELCSYYSQRPKGTLMAVLNSWDRVEVSMCEGRAADCFIDRSIEEFVVELREAGKR